MADEVNVSPTTKVTLRVFGREEEPRDFELKARKHVLVCCPLGLHGWTEWSRSIRAEVYRDAVVVMVPSEAFFSFKVCPQCGAVRRREVH